MSTTLDTTLSSDQRRALLESTVASHVRGGWRVESHTDYQATLAKGKHTNHVLHLILTLLTLGIWAIVWILVVTFGGEKREVVSVDETGKIHVRH